MVESEGRQGGGCLRGSEVRRFTLVVNLDLYRLTNYNTLLQQREDVFGNRECTAASNLPPQQVYRVWRLHTCQHCRLMAVNLNVLWIAGKSLNADNKSKISEHADNNCFQVGEWKEEVFPF